MSASTEQEEEDDGHSAPEWTHAAFHQGNLVASSGGYPFKMRMNGRGMKEVDAMPTVFMV